jgi:hypothetical protein
LKQIQCSRRAPRRWQSGYTWLIATVFHRDDRDMKTLQQFTRQLQTQRAERHIDDEMG